MYGSSAGAINATYFLSGQREGVHIYTEEIANKDFIDLGRLINLTRKPQGERLCCCSMESCMRQALSSLFCMSREDY